MIEHPKKMVCYWMSREEGRDEKLMTSLKPQFQEWRSKKYQPVIYISGTSRLEDCIYMLMKRNYESILKNNQKRKYRYKYEDAELSQNQKLGQINDEMLSPKMN